MTFEPLIHISPVMAVLQVLMWTAFLTLGVFLLTYVLFYLPWKLLRYVPSKYGNEADRKDRIKFVWMVTGVWFVLGFIFIGTGLDSQRYHANVNTVSQNIIKKYEVEQVTFPPRPTGRGYHGDTNYPEQSEEQPVTVKSNGKSRMALLTQDEKTSEPTLLDVDTREPMGDILRK